MAAGEREKLYSLELLGLAVRLSQYSGLYSGMFSRSDLMKIS